MIAKILKRAAHLLEEDMVRLRSTNVATDGSWRTGSRADRKRWNNERNIAQQLRDIAREVDRHPDIRIRLEEVCDLPVEIMRTP